LLPSRKGKEKLYLVTVKQKDSDVKKIAEYTEQVSVYIAFSMFSLVSARRIASISECFQISVT